MTKTKDFVSAIPQGVNFVNILRAVLAQLDLHCKLQSQTVIKETLSKESTFMQKSGV